MPRVLLINPNANMATTAMMVAIAQSAVPRGVVVEGRTAGRGVPMIVNAREMEVAAHDVYRCWTHEVDAGWSGVVISAFCDPGIELVRKSTHLPVVGICEAALHRAAHGQRRFGIATVTPELGELIDERIAELGLTGLYAGLQLTHGEPRRLASRPEALEDALSLAVGRCISEDGAQAVVIGGGPLGQAAAHLQALWSQPIVAPIPSAMHRLAAELELE